MASFYLVCGYVFATISILLPGMLQITNAFLPTCVRDLLLYGKAKGKGNKSGWACIRLIEIPKRYFLHFYLLGTIVNGSVLLIVSCAYFSHKFTIPQFMSQLLAWIKDADSEVTTGAVSVVIAIGMMAIQNIRRVYECVFVSVYSKGTMNLLHYSIGCGLYTTYSLTVLCEAEDLKPIAVSPASIHWYHMAGIILFLLASWQHHEAHVTLANLRKKEGEVNTLTHKIPHGGLFKYISSPHYFCECLIYVSMALACGGYNFTVWAVVVFVVCNQFIASMITHQWYLRTFKSYRGLNRKALIPFVL